MTRLETERLLLRPLEMADAEAIQRLFPHWEIVEWLAAGVPWPYPVDGAEQFVRDAALPGMARGEEFYWTLRLRSAPDSAIGLIMLTTVGESQRGFWLGREWQGQGLMTEAAAAVTEFWFGTLGMPRLRVHKAAGNEASRRISAGHGMRLVDEFEKEFVGGRRPAELWEMNAEEWWAHRKQGTGRRWGE